MIVFADTSGFFALLAHDDYMHARAKLNFAHFAHFGSHDFRILTTSYVILETTALLDRRIGLSSVADFQAKIVPLLEIVWVDAEWHARALQRLFTIGKKRREPCGLPEFRSDGSEKSADSVLFRQALRRERLSPGRLSRPRCNAILSVQRARHRMIGRECCRKKGAPAPAMRTGAPMFRAGGDESRPFHVTGYCARISSASLR